jgi:hypothetical protein
MGASKMYLSQQSVVFFTVAVGEEWGVVGSPIWKSKFYVFFVKLASGQIFITEIYFAH